MHGLEFSKQIQIRASQDHPYTDVKDEFVHRLRNRVPHPGFEELVYLTDFLCNQRLELTQQSEFVPSLRRM